MRDGFHGRRLGVVFADEYEVSLKVCRDEGAVRAKVSHAGDDVLARRPLAKSTRGFTRRERVEFDPRGCPDIHNFAVTEREARAVRGKDHQTGLFGVRDGFFGGCLRGERPTLHSTFLASGRPWLRSAGGRHVAIV